jgi:type I restriction enzyme M protein
MDLYANTIPKPDGLTFQEVIGHADEAHYWCKKSNNSLLTNWAFLEPADLFSELAQRGNAGGKTISFWVT